MKYLAGVELDRSGKTKVYLGDTAAVKGDGTENLEELDILGYLQISGRVNESKRKEFIQAFNKCLDLAKSHLSFSPDLSTIKVWNACHRRSTCWYDFKDHSIKNIRTPLRQQRSGGIGTGEIVTYSPTDPIYDTIHQKTIKLDGVASPELRTLFYIKENRITTKKLRDNEIDQAIQIALWDTRQELPIEIFYYCGRYFLIPLMFSDKEMGLLEVPLLVNDRTGDERSLINKQEECIVAVGPNKVDGNINIGKIRAGCLSTELGRAQIAYPNSRSEFIESSVIDIERFNRVEFLNEAYRNNGKNHILLYNGILNLDEKLATTKAKSRSTGQKKRSTKAVKVNKPIKER